MDDFKDFLIMLIRTAWNKKSQIRIEKNQWLLIRIYKEIIFMQF